jgi:hypothetical protein
MAGKMPEMRAKNPAKRRHMPSLRREKAFAEMALEICFSP